MIRVILADDHAMLRAGLKRLLEALGDVDVVAETDNGRDTVALARKHGPDVIVMDVAMPDMNGIDATRRLARILPQVKVLALSSHGDGAYVRGMLEAGARGYLVKEAAADELPVALDRILRGRVYVSPAITDQRVEDYLRLGNGAADPGPAPRLSTREREVLQLVAEGKSSVDIAGILHLSRRTVETHRRRIMDKLGIRSVAGLTKYAIREGITSLYD